MLPDFLPPRKPTNIYRNHAVYIGDKIRNPLQIK